jgi:hypothetical protein
LKLDSVHPCQLWISIFSHALADAHMVYSVSCILYESLTKRRVKPREADAPYSASRREEEKSSWDMGDATVASRVIMVDKGQLDKIVSRGPGVIAGNIGDIHA